MDLCGSERRISLFTFPEEATGGDHVLVRAGFTIQKANGKVARETLDVLKEMAEAIEEENAP